MNLSAETDAKTTKADIAWQNYGFYWIYFMGIITISIE